VHAPFSRGGVGGGEGGGLFGFVRQCGVWRTGSPRGRAGVRDAAPYLHGFIDAELVWAGLSGGSYASWGSAKVAMRRGPYYGLTVAPQLFDPWRFQGSRTLRLLAEELANRAPVLIVHGDADEALSVPLSHDAGRTDRCGVRWRRIISPDSARDLLSGDLAGGVGVQRGFA